MLKKKSHFTQGFTISGPIGYFLKLVIFIDYHPPPIPGPRTSGAGPIRVHILPPLNLESIFKLSAVGWNKRTTNNYISNKSELPFTNSVVTQQLFTERATNQLKGIYGSQSAIASERYKNFRNKQPSGKHKKYIV